MATLTRWLHTDPTGPPESTPEFAGSDASSTQTAAPSGAPNPPKRRQGRLRKVVILVAVVLVLLVVLLLALYAIVVNFVARPYTVPSEAMEPTLHGCSGCVSDLVMVDELAYRSSSPQRGDVIVFMGPPSWNVGYKSIRSDNTALRWAQNVLSVLGFVPPDENDLVKRVIAVGGQTVQCRADTGLTVDGKPLTVLPLI